MSAGQYGTLNLNGGLSANPFTTLTFNLGSPVNNNTYTGDLINLGAGSLNVTGGSGNINFVSNPTASGDYRLFQGSNLGSASLNFTLPAAPQGDTYSLTLADTGYLDLAVASAATFSGSGTWVSSSGTTWSNGSNWLDGNGQNGVPGTAGRPADTATFSGSGSVTAITLDVNPSLAALSFSTSNYTLSGGSLTFSSSSGTAALTVASGTQTIASAADPGQQSFDRSAGGIAVDPFGQHRRHGGPVADRRRHAGPRRRQHAIAAARRFRRAR